MKKCIVVDRSMILSGAKSGFRNGVVIALYKIVNHLEYDLIIYSEKSDDSYSEHINLEAFLDSQGIEVTRHVTDENLTEILPILMHNNYDPHYSSSVSKNEKVASFLSENGFTMLAEDAGMECDWQDVYEKLKPVSRSAGRHRKSAETEIKITINLDGQGHSEISTGLNFFDHMLDQIARHAGVDLMIRVNGDLQVDEHHTIEDTGLVLGDTLFAALGNKVGIERYGFFLPMDDSVCRIALDFSGRPQLVWKVGFKREKIGDVPTELFEHFFKSFCDTAKCNLYVEAEGGNEHHKIEAVFKAFARALKEAIRKDFDNPSLPSTKGLL